MFQKQITGYVLAVLGVITVTATLEPIHFRISVTTVALTLLMKDGNRLKVFSQNGFSVKVFVFLYHKNKNALPKDLYPGYWIDKMDDVIDKILAEI